MHLSKVIPIWLAAARLGCTLPLDSVYEPSSDGVDDFEATDVLGNDNLEARQWRPPNFPKPTYAPPDAGGSPDGGAPKPHRRSLDSDVLEARQMRPPNFPRPTYVPPDAGGSPDGGAPKLQRRALDEVLGKREANTGTSTVRPTPKAFDEGYVKRQILARPPRPTEHPPWPDLTYADDSDYIEKREAKSKKPKPTPKPPTDGGTDGGAPKPIDDGFKKRDIGGRPCTRWPPIPNARPCVPTDMPELASRRRSIEDFISDGNNNIQARDKSKPKPKPKPKPQPLPQDGGAPDAGYIWVKRDAVVPPPTATTTEEDELHALEARAIPPEDDLPKIPEPTILFPDPKETLIARAEQQSDDHDDDDELSIPFPLPARDVEEEWAEVEYEDDDDGIVIGS